MTIRRRNRKTSTLQGREEMSASSTHARDSRYIWVLAALMVAALFMIPATAGALEIEEFSGQLADKDGERVLQAGARADFTTTISFPTHLSDQGVITADDNVKDIEVELPPGLIGNPGAAPTCSLAQMKAGRFDNYAPNCPPETQVGISYTALGYLFAPVPFEERYPVINITPPPGVPARFAFNAAGVVVVIDAAVRTGRDYGITADVHNISQAIPLLRSEVKFWGVPSDPSNDDERYPEGSFVPGASTTAPRKPFMSMPTRCTGSFAMTMRTRSWLEQEKWLTATIGSDVTGEPFGARGCENVPFKPSIKVSVEEEQADTPTGFGLELSLPQNQDPDGPATAHLKRAEVTLPEGMAINPTSADGRASCAPAQIRVSDDSVPSCPDGSKLGTVEIDTPLLQDPLKGGIYLAKQNENPFGSMLAIYLVAEGPGVVIKLPGRIEADAETGRVTASFDDNPQLPFDTLSAKFEGGARAPLVTPPSCGSKTVHGTFSSWAMPADAIPSSDTFQITSGPNGEACPNGSFDPKLTAGTLNSAAGQHSPFVIRLSRKDGAQRLAGLDLTLPKGLLGKLAGIPYCSETALAAVSAAQGTGASQIVAPSCPAASQVGVVSVGAGAGTNPLYVNSGKAYLAGPYKGAPLSLAIVTPAVAGPYDLGSVLVRTALHIDPVTTQLSALSDPIPTILHGIPLNLRDLRIDIDRPDFILNPTGCDPRAISGLARSASGLTALLGEHFQAVNCERLAFKPKLALKFSGPTHRSAHPALKATLTMPKGGANIGKAVVTLPATELLENAHIRTICTRVQYAANQCPKGSIYGYAKAWTPLLDKPLQGPVYLRSSNHTLPDLVASLDGQIHVDLAGRIDSPRGRIRNTFWAVPDAPVSKFVLRMQGGKKSLLANNTELCKAKPRVRAEFTGQNGKRSVSNPLVKLGCGKGAGKR